ncbi:MAG: alkaline phosphatase PafA [Cryomorphaceae bacterium]|nr:alkaline phosphatase family protein [Flavobacteriales bacterium]
MKFLSAILFTLFTVLAFAQNPDEKPRLIVGLVVDQMRSDYIERYRDSFGEGGLNLIIKDGFYAANTHFSYMPTYTGPGHASIYTGTTPAVHGIASNNWYDPQVKEVVYCTDDKSVRTIGAQNADGQMSPVKLKTTTITDELKLASNFRSKVIGVSIKDRGAILPAGHVPDGAYWLSNTDFITSSFFADELPSWVVDFNAEKWVDHYVDEGWGLLLPADQYTSSLADENPYEYAWEGEEASTFPKDLRGLVESNGLNNMLRYSPHGNSLIFQFAEAAVKSEDLGKDADTDFLALGFSSTDYLGHNYGPRAMEIEDTYIRLDREIEKFIGFLNEEVGEGNYTLFITSDHGAAEVPQYAIDNQIPAGYVDEKGDMAILDSLLQSIHPKGMDLIEKVDDNKVFFDRAVLAEEGVDVLDISRKLAEKLTAVKSIYAAYPSKELIWGGANQFPTDKLVRGLYPVFSGDVTWVRESGWISYSNVGTTHGSPWNYDTHVPLMFYGKGVTPGKTHRETHICDIAPTLSMLFGIPLPSGATGKPILEVFGK